MLLNRVNILFPLPERMKCMCKKSEPRRTVILDFVMPDVYIADDTLPQQRLRGVQMKRCAHCYFCALHRIINTTVSNAALYIFGHVSLC